jgi:Cu2+-exporting ATPase
MEGSSCVFVSIDGSVAGALILDDPIRPDTPRVLRTLRRAGVKRVVMVTGDHPDVAESVGISVGVDRILSERDPTDKVDAVTAERESGVTIMVGDGVNDAPALAQADVGIAIGAGTDVAIETADVILVENDPRDVADVIALSRLTHRKMVQNLLWATGYNVVAIPLAAGVLYHYGVVLPPAGGAVVMSLSTIIVAVNARLISYRKKERGADAGFPRREGVPNATTPRCPVPFRQ